MSRKGSNGGPGGLFAPVENQNVTGTPPFSVAHGGHVTLAKYYVDPVMESPPFKLSVCASQILRGAPIDLGVRRIPGP
jgi:hypothetical protein